jgi:hypothetical protein
MQGSHHLWLEAEQLMGKVKLQESNLDFGKPMQTYGAFADKDLQVMDVPSLCDFTGGHC